MIHYQAYKSWMYICSIWYFSFDIISVIIITEFTVFISQFIPEDHIKVYCVFDLLHGSTRCSMTCIFNLNNLVFLILPQSFVNNLFIQVASILRIYHFFFIWLIHRIIYCNCTAINVFTIPCFSVNSIWHKEVVKWWIILVCSIG